MIYELSIYRKTLQDKKVRLYINIVFYAEKEYIKINSWSAFVKSQNTIEKRL